MAPHVLLLLIADISQIPTASLVQDTIIDGYQLPQIRQQEFVHRVRHFKFPPSLFSPEVNANAHNMFFKLIAIQLIANGVQPTVLAVRSHVLL